MATDSGARVPARAVMWLERRLVNPLVERLLRSPLHPVLSRWLVLLEYEGRVSGNRITTPILYGRLDGSVVATTDRNATSWWKNFRGGHPATLWVESQPVAVTGRAVLDAAAIADASTELADASWLWRLALRGLGVRPSDSTADIEAAAGDVVLVVFD